MGLVPSTMLFGDAMLRLSARSSAAPAVTLTVMLPSGSHDAFQNTLKRKVVLVKLTIDPGTTNALVMMPCGSNAAGDRARGRLSVNARPTRGGCTVDGLCERDVE